MLLLILVLTFISCSSEDDPVIPEVTVNAGQTNFFENAMDFESSESQQILRFTTNVDWTLTFSSTQSGNTWCTISQSQGSAGDHAVIVKVASNDGYEDRNVVLRLTAGNITKTVIINQKQKDAITLTTNKFEVGTEGGIINIEVKSNVNYEIEIPSQYKEWISQASKSRGLSTTTLSFNIAESKEYDKREGEINIKSGNLTETVKIYQIGSSILVLSQNEFTLGNEGGTITIEISSNFEYSIDMPNVSWLKSVDDSRAVSSHTLRYEVAANSTYDNREATIIFKDTKSSKQESVTIKQKQKDAILLSQNKVEINQDGGTFFVEVNSNIEYSIEIPSACKNWISQSNSSRSLSKTTPAFTVSSSDEYEKREGEIYFKNNDVADTLKVYQAGGAILVLSNSYFNIDGEENIITIPIKSNIEYNIRISDENWIKKIETRAISTSNPSFSISENKSGKNRNGYIIFSTKDGIKKDSVYISQSNLSPELIISQTSYKLDGQEQNLSVELKSNYDCETILPDVDWISIITSRTLVSSTFFFRIAENNTFESRTAEIVIKTIDGSKSTTIQIEQNYKLPEVEDNIWDGTIASTYYSYGNGSAKSPYMITTCAQMAKLSQEVNNGNSFAEKYFLVLANLDFNNQIFTSIGSEATPFSGNFDGNGKQLIGISVNGKSYQGLFGYTKSATINDIYIRITTKYDNSCQYIGGVVGYAKNTQITNCCTFGHVNGWDCVGSLVGFLDTNSSLLNCYSACQNTCANIDGSVGGLVGYNCGKIHCCYFYGSINARTFSSYTTGGVVGYNHTTGYMNHCYYMYTPVGAMQKIGYCGTLNWGTCYNCSSFDLYGLVNGTYLYSKLNSWVNANQTSDNYYRKWTSESYPQFVY